VLCYRNNVEKKTVLENLDLVLLCLDEIIDGGYVFWILCTINVKKCLNEITYAHV
jgi:hypothetical protein